jgi:hypothetical protein
MKKSFLVSCLLILTLAGCATYETPGGAVSLTGIESQDVRDLFTREAAAQFPANIAVARVQAAGYIPRHGSTHGTGAFTVLTKRELLLEEEFDSMKRWPSVQGVAPLSRLLIPAHLTSLDDLRRSSAALKTDILLVFTVDTAFRVDGKSIGPMSVVSLGWLRDRETVVSSTASAAIIDVRTGFVYGVAEATADETKRASAWSSSSKVDQSRNKTEAKAFDDLITELERTWINIVVEHS